MSFFWLLYFAGLAIGITASIHSDLGWFAGFALTLACGFMGGGIGVALEIRDDA